MPEYTWLLYVTDQHGRRTGQDGLPMPYPFHSDDSAQDVADTLCGYFAKSLRDSSPKKLEVEVWEGRQAVESPHARADWP
ncbi:MULTISPECIES: hypothetical protein [Kitasatospora]|uniref:hypothetical protein n=1 Tax=Kitasatospora TaxID=2063 RepID=UPI000C6FFB37|nr:hypothetical protein [Kitasatospora sp. GP30]MDH6143512.1 hypothetical protein [Kitasatospora sp. GP30]